MEPEGSSTGTVLLEDEVFVLDEDLVVVVEEALEELGILLEDTEELLEETGILLDDPDDLIKPVEELILDEEIIVKELSVGSPDDGVPEFGFPKKEDLEELKGREELAEEVLLEELLLDDCAAPLDDCAPLDNCAAPLDETGNSVIPLHEVLSPCVLCEPTSTIFTELSLSEVPDILQPLSRKTAAKAAAKNLFFILFSPFMYLIFLLFIYS